MLFRKLFRDLMGNKGSNIAVMVVIAVGIMVYTSFSILMDTLTESVDVFYEQGKFPDGYINILPSAPNAYQSLFSVDGIQNAEGRTTKDVQVNDDFGVPTKEKKYIRLISLGQDIGKIVLVEGKEPEPGQNQIVLDINFANINGVKVGDRIPAIVSGRNISLEVTGLGQSPEYIYALRNQSDIYPDPATFSTAFMHLNDLNALTGNNAITEIMYTVKNDADANEVKMKVESSVEQYGVLSSYLRENQMSNFMLHQEINQLKGSIVVMPVLFLGVSSMILFIMVRRIVQQQRGQIGLMKAFGVSNLQIFAHYLLYAVIISVLGGVLGNVLGYSLYKYFVDIYKQFFNMPFIDQSLSLRYMILGISLSGFFGVLAGFGASLQASKLAPAEAMREKPPDKVGFAFIEKIKPFMYMFTTAGRMSIRNIFRNPARSFFIFIGILFTFSLAVVPWSFIRLTDEILFSNYDTVERYTVKMNLSGMMNLQDALAEISEIPDVKRAEGQLELPVIVSKGGLKENITVLGIPADSNLYILEKNHKKIPLPSGSGAISQRLADKLMVSRGDKIQISSSYFKDKELKNTLVISDIVDQTVGMSIYVDLDYLSHFIGDDTYANNLLIRAPYGTAEQLRLKYQDSEKVVGTNDIRDTLEKMKEFIGSSLESMNFMALISVVMGFAIIYNSYSIILSERRREFASLMVMGMSEKEVVSIVKLEQWLITALAIPIGIPVTAAMVKWVGIASSSDMFTITLHLDPVSSLIGFVITVGIIFTAQLVASRKINKIIISEALKANE